MNPSQSSTADCVTSNLDQNPVGVRSLILNPNPSQETAKIGAVLTNNVAPEERETQTRLPIDARYRNNYQLTLATGYRPTQKSRRKLHGNKVPTPKLRHTIRQEQNIEHFRASQHVYE